MSKSVVLKELKSEDLPKLLQLLKCDFPRSIHAYSFLETLEKWRQKNGFEYKIVSPGGNFRSGFFLYRIFKTDVERLDGTFWAWEGHKDLIEGLKNYDLEWSKYAILLTCMQEDTWRRISEAMKEKWGEMRESHDNVYWLPWQDAKAIQVEIPDGMYIEDLKAEHAKIMNSVWPHRFPGSDSWMAEIIENNYGLGLFSRGSGELCAWAALWFYGGVGALQTLDHHRRKGFASAVSQAIIRKMGSEGIDVHLNVVGGNEPANLFFTKLGLRFAFHSVWAFSPSYKGPDQPKD